MDGVNQTNDACEALKADLTDAALYIIDQKIEDILNSEGYWNKTDGRHWKPRPQTWETQTETYAHCSMSIDFDEEFWASGQEECPGDYEQIEGVDEADFFKSNDKQAFAIYGGREIIELHMKPDSMDTIASRTMLPEIPGCGNGGSILGMLLTANRVIVIAERENTWECHSNSIVGGGVTEVS